jgi:protein tyrosine phosphatase (PTP) superfamily phosphohydrolase (DUF442 family)
MLNARRFDDRITIGAVPTNEELEQIKELGYKTLVDVRSEEEKLGGHITPRALALGLHVVEVPVSPDAIKMEDVERFYFAVFERGSAPLYVSSRFGKKPLAFLLLVEMVAENQPLNGIFRRAGAFGLNLEGDQWLQEFLVRLMNSGEIQPIVDSIRKLRPELLERSVRPGPARKLRDLPSAADPIAAALAETRRSWLETRDTVALRKHLLELVLRLEGQ